MINISILQRVSKSKNIGKKTVLLFYTSNQTVTITCINCVNGTNKIVEESLFSDKQNFVDRKSNYHVISSIK